MMHHLTPARIHTGHPIACLQIMLRAALINTETEAATSVAILEPTTSLWTMPPTLEDYEYGENSHESDATMPSRYMAVDSAYALPQAGELRPSDPEMPGSKAYGQWHTHRQGNLSSVDSYSLHCDRARNEHALHRFVQIGGVLLCVGCEPEYLTNGSPLSHPLPIHYHFSVGEEQPLIDALLTQETPVLRIKLSVACQNQCMSHLRVTSDGVPWLFVTNQESKPFGGVLYFPAHWRAVKRISCDGQPDQVLPADKVGCVQFQLEPFESVWLTAAELPPYHCTPADNLAG